MKFTGMQQNDGRLAITGKKENIVKGKNIVELKKIDYEFSVCKVDSLEEIDMSQEFCFIGKTDEEISVVCMTEAAPANVIER